MNCSGGIVKRYMICQTCGMKWSGINPDVYIEGKSTQTVQVIMFTGDQYIILNSIQKMLIHAKNISLFKPYKSNNYEF